MELHKNYDRITFSLPKSIHNALNELKNESQKSKSELIQNALQYYLDLQKKQKLNQAVKLMTHEYKVGAQLTEFTSLDSEDFYATR
jgi:metal-responsive CopG/Arc/MetJ family transcriptional regulator